MDIPNARQFHIHPSMMSGDAVIIPIGDLYRQLTKVLRLRTADAVRFFDGMGNVAEGTIAHINKDGILVPIAQRAVQPRGRHVTLAIGILKNDRMKTVLEKAAELGVSHIIPMITERVVKRPEKVPPRWYHIVREAAEQSGRAWLPEVAEVMTLKQVLETQEDLVFYTPDRAKTELPGPSHKHPTLLIGPEGGFTSEEMSLAQDHASHFGSLGEHQLRADTAAIVAIARHTL